MVFNPLLRETGDEGARMADESANANDVFRRSTMNRVSSSEELDHYIKVTNPSAWIVTLAALLLVGGVLVWAFVATVPVTIETTGIAPAVTNPDDTKVLCMVDKTTAEHIQESGAKAFIEGVEAESVQVSKTPLSASEVISLLGSDFYADSIEINDWNYMVDIKPSGKLNHTDFEINGKGFQAHLVPVSIVVSETRPINIVSGKMS